MSHEGHTKFLEDRLEMVQESLKQIPRKPGVYFFKDTSSHILYIGKAKELRTRVRSYFQKNRHQSAKNISTSRALTSLSLI